MDPQSWKGRCPGRQGDRDGLSGGSRAFSHVGHTRRLPRAAPSDRQSSFGARGVGVKGEVRRFGLNHGHLRSLKLEFKKRKGKKNTLYARSEAVDDEDGPISSGTHARVSLNAGRLWRLRASFHTRLRSVHFALNKQPSRGPKTESWAQTQTKSPLHLTSHGGNTGPGANPLRCA